MAGVKYRSSAVRRLHVLGFMAGESLTVKAETEATFLEHTVDQQRAVEAELRLVHARFQCPVAGGISASPLLVR